MAIEDASDKTYPQWPDEVVWTPYEPVEGGEGSVAAITGYKYPRISKPCPGSDVMEISCRAIKYGPRIHGTEPRCHVCNDRTRVPNVSLDTLVPTVIEHVAENDILGIQHVPIDGWPDSVTVSLLRVDSDGEITLLPLITAGSLETALLGALRRSSNGPVPRPAPKKSSRKLKEEAKENASE